MNHLLGVITCSLHTDFRWSIHITEFGFTIGDHVWSNPIQFHELFEAGWAFADKMEAYES